MFDFKRLWPANDRFPLSGRKQKSNDDRKQIKVALRQRIDEIRSLRNDIRRESNFYKRYLLSQDIQSRYELLGMLWHQYRILGRNSASGMSGKHKNNTDNTTPSSPYKKIS